MSLVVTRVSALLAYIPPNSSTYGCVRRDCKTVAYFQRQVRQSQITLCASFTHVAVAFSRIVFVISENYFL